MGPKRKAPDAASNAPKKATNSKKKPTEFTVFLEELETLVSLESSENQEGVAKSEPSPMVKASILISNLETTVTCLKKKCWTLDALFSLPRRDVAVKTANNFNKTLNVLDTHDNVFQVCQWLYRHGFFQLGQLFDQALGKHDDPTYRALLQATSEGVRRSECEEKNLHAAARVVVQWAREQRSSEVELSNCCRSILRRLSPKIACVTLNQNPDYLFPLLDDTTILEITRNIWESPTDGPLTTRINRTLSTFRKSRPSAQKDIVDYLKSNSQNEAAGLCVSEWNLHSCYPEYNKNPLRLPPNVTVVFVATERDAQWAYDILRVQGIVGLDMESRPTFRTGVRNEVALFQVATVLHVFLFDLTNLTRDSKATKCIEMVLQNEAILKVGMDFKQDLQTMHRTYPYACFKSFTNLVDIGSLFGVMYNDSPTTEFALRKQVHFLLQQPLSKSQQLSNWTQRPLTSAQTHYAALDAHVLITMTEKMLAENKQLKDDLPKFKQSYAIGP